MQSGSALGSSAAGSGAAAGAHAAAQLPKLASGAQYATWRAEAQVWLDRHGANAVHTRTMVASEWETLQKQVLSWQDSDIAEAMASLTVPEESKLAAPSPVKQEDREAEEAVKAAAKESGAKRERFRKTLTDLHALSIRIYGALYTALSGDMRLQVDTAVPRGCANRLWLWLENKYQPIDQDNVGVLLSEWSSTRQEEEESFDAYRARVDRLKGLLTRAKEQPSDAMYSHVLTDRLQLRYSQVVLALKSANLLKVPSAIDWEDITERINNFERSGSTQAEQAHMARFGRGNREGQAQRGAGGSGRGSGRRGRGRGGRRTPGCWTCGDLSHQQWECPDGEEEEGSSAPSSRSGREGQRGRSGAGGQHASRGRGGRREQAAAAYSRNDTVNSYAIFDYGDDEGDAGGGADFTYSAIEDESWLERAFGVVKEEVAMTVRRLISPGTEQHKIESAARIEAAKRASAQQPGAAAAASGAKKQAGDSAAPAAEAAAAASRPAANKQAEQGARGPRIGGNMPKDSEKRRDGAGSAQPAVRRPAVELEPQRSVGCSIDKALMSDSWGIDSMASTSVSGNKALFEKLSRCAEVRIKVANGEYVRATQTGTVVLKFLDTKKRLVQYKLDQVLYSPDFASNLLCLTRLTRHKNWEYHAGPDGTFMITPDGAKVPVITTGRISMLLGAGTERVYGAIIARDESPSADMLVLLHQRLSHMGFAEMIKLVRSGRTDLGKIEVKESVVEAARLLVRECRACALGKQTRTALEHRGLEVGKKPGEVLHMDSYVIKFEGRDGLPKVQYSVSIKDTCSGEGYQVIVDSKDQIANHVIEKLAQIQRQDGVKIKCIRSDGGTEFLNQTLNNYLKKEGIVLRVSPPYTPQLNGVAERSIRTYKDLARTVLHHAGAPVYLWKFAMMHVVWLWNRTRVNNPMEKTVYEQHTGKVPQISAQFIGVWGCDVFVHQRKDQRRGGAMAPKAEPGVYLGHSDRYNAPLVLVLGLGVIGPAKDVKFLNRSFRHLQAYKEFKTEVAPAAAVAGRVPHDSGTQFEETEARGGVDQPSNDSDGLGGALGGPGGAGPAADAETEDQEFPVEKILGSRGSGSKTELRVKWSGCSDAENSWEPVANLDQTVAYQQWLDQASAEAEADQPKDSFSPRVTRSRSARGPEAEDEEVGVERTSMARAEMVMCAVRGMQAEEESGRAGDDDLVFSAVSAGVSAVRESSPENIRDALNSKDRLLWQAARDKEKKACEDMGVWTPVSNSEVNKGSTVLACKEVCKIKTDENGAVVQHKVRWTVRGDYQKPGRDYTIGETFARTAMHKTERVALSLASRFDSELVQFDVPTAFLNADVKEDVYMRLPADYGGTIVKLNKALYGLVQAPANWDKLISGFITNEMGWKATVSDPSFYYKRSRSGRLMLIYRFVDDMQGQYDRRDEVEFGESSGLLRERFNIKQMATSSWMLGMRITRDRRARTIKLDQELYVTKALERYGLAECKVASSPEIPGADTCVGDGLDAPADRQRYMEMVGSLMYAAISTRPDIAHAVHYLASAMQAPTVRHMRATERVFRYLAGTLDCGLVFGNGELSSSSGHRQFQTEVCAFADASWGDKVFGRKSLTGWVAKINGDVYAWAAKKQKVVANSTCEAELYAESEAIKEVLWMRGLLQELGLHPRTGSPASIVYGDNQGTIAISKNGVKSERTKHIDIKYQFVTETIANGIIKLVWVPTDKQDADIFTKALHTPLFVSLRKRLMSY